MVGSVSFPRWAFPFSVRLRDRVVSWSLAIRRLFVWVSSLRRDSLKMVDRSVTVYPVAASGEACC